jgi:hypothetical protein
MGKHGPRKYKVYSRSTPTGAMLGPRGIEEFVSHYNPAIHRSFWSRVALGDDRECWEWRGRTTRAGYGQTDVLNWPVLAHRIAWVMAFGVIENGLYVLHSCDNRPCVNPAHLFLGTQKDNINDMIRKGRQRFGGIHAR